MKIVLVIIYGNCTGLCFLVIAFIGKISAYPVGSSSVNSDSELSVTEALLTVSSETEGASVILSGSFAQPARRVRQRTAVSIGQTFLTKTPSLCQAFLPSSNAFLLSSRNFGGTHFSIASCQSFSSKSVCFETTPISTTFEAFAFPASSARERASTAVT